MTKINKQQTEGLEFIFSHFPSPKDEPQQPYLPRPVSSALTDGQQRTAFSIEYLGNICETANWIDIKVGAYPKFTYLMEKGRVPWGYVPKHWQLLIDQDEGDLQVTLHKIKMYLGGVTPSVIFTGHGFHIYIPLKITNKEILSNLELAIDYMRFLEKYVTNNQSDKGHYPSFNSCMMRVPGSHNQECITERIPSEVTIIQKWDGFRTAPSSHVFDEFMKVQNKKRLIEAHQARKDIELIKKYGSLAAANKELQDPLTDFLIFHSKGITDGRKNTLYYIIAKYLIRVKGVTDKATAEGICAEWLRRSNRLKPIKNTSHYMKYHIRHCVQDAIHKDANPYPVSYLKTWSPEAYELLLAEYEEFNQNNKTEVFSS